MQQALLGKTKVYHNEWSTFAMKNNPLSKYMIFQNQSRRHFHLDGIVESKSEKDLVEFVEGNGAPSFKTEGLTLEQLRDLLLGGPSNFKIIRANDSDSSISSKY